MSTLYSKPGIDYLLFHTRNDLDLHYAFIELCSENFDQEAYYNELINAVENNKKQARDFIKSLI